MRAIAEGQGGFFRVNRPSQFTRRAGELIGLYRHFRSPYEYNMTTLGRPAPRAL